MSSACLRSGEAKAHLAGNRVLRHGPPKPAPTTRAPRQRRSFPVPEQERAGTGVGSTTSRSPRALLTSKQRGVDAARCGAAIERCWACRRLMKAGAESAGAARWCIPAGRADAWTGRTQGEWALERKRAESLDPGFPTLLQPSFGDGYMVEVGSPKLCAARHVLRRIRVSAADQCPQMCPQSQAASA